MEGFILVVGLGFGYLTGIAFKRNYILKTAPEADLIAEIKRRRVNERLTAEAEKSVTKDLEDL